jgi:tRNA uridine 5-carboxymethylaminomethyl modification enzyme
MFTNRAECRLLPNHGSADVRLFDVIRDFGLIDGDILARTAHKLERINFLTRKLENIRSECSVADCSRQKFGKIESETLPEELLRESKQIIDEVIYRASYSGYIEREHRQIAKLRDMGFIKIPPNFCDCDAKNLKAESLQKLELLKPVALGAASRISGISPVDIGTIWVYLEKLRRAEATSFFCLAIAR